MFSFLFFSVDWIDVNRFSFFYFYPPFFSAVLKINSGVSSIHKDAVHDRYAVYQSVSRDVLFLFSE